MNLERFGRLVFDKNMNYSAIIIVNGAMMNGDIVFARQTTSTAKITVHPFRDLHDEPCRHLGVGVRRNSNGFGGGEIITCGAGGSFSRKTCFIRCCCHLDMEMVIDVVMEESIKG